MYLPVWRWCASPIARAVTHALSRAKLWRKAQRTLYVNMRDNFMDCPDRERAPYTGDEAVCFAQIPYALSPEAYMLMRKAVSEFFAWQRKDSVLYGPVPSETWTKEMPQQSLAFLAEGLWSYYMTTGDIATIKPLLPAFRKYLSLWTLQTTGLPSYRKGGWEWGDWGTGVDLTALHDAWYAAALRTYASLSAEAKYLYTLMLDRASISRENGYLEPDGSIRIYFTVEDVRQKLHKGKQRSVAVLRELEVSGLIRRRKRGQGRPAIITLYYPDSVRFVERKGEARDL